MHSPPPGGSAVCRPAEWDLLSPFPNSYDHLPTESDPDPRFDLVEDGALCWPTIADRWFARGVFRGIGAGGSYKPHFWLRSPNLGGCRTTNRRLSMPILADGVRRSRHSLEQLILSEFRRRGTPAVHPPADSIATVVFALFQGLVKQRRIDPDAVPEELFETALTWLFTGLAGAGESAATATDAGTTTET